MDCRSEPGRNQVKIGSESGPGWIGSEGRGLRGRSGLSGPVAPPESLDQKFWSDLLPC